MRTFSKVNSFGFAKVESCFWKFFCGKKPCQNSVFCKVVVGDKKFVHFLQQNFSGKLFGKNLFFCCFVVEVTIPFLFQKVRDPL